MTTAFKMINSPTSVVDEMLRGLVHSSPDLCLVPDYRIVLHRDYNDLKQRQVTLLSGGGSGHEPAHAGYIGHGMLTGVICGDGDRLNFGLAIETAKAEGLNVDMVVIGDDLAIPDAKAGHRGLAGTVFVHKIAGAMAAQGFPLAKIAEQLQQLAIGTMGVAWNSCTLPASEVGHDRVVVMVNNLGSTTSMELQVIVHDVRQYCVAQQLVVERVAVGSFMTALDMSGFSLTLWKLSEEQATAQLGWLDTPVTAAAWPARLGRFTDDNVVNVHDVAPAKPSSASTLTITGELLKRAIYAATQSIIQAEADLTDWDTKVGDGDCGLTLAAGAKAIQHDLATYPLNIPSKTLLAVASSIANAIGGTSGGTSYCTYKYRYAGADATKRIAAHDAFGRTSYVGEEAVKNIPDPGAMAVAIWIQALVPHLQTE
ncbi:hypothetical protein DYB37_004690 [Aphanomyces astaci]|uniref:DhaK domain-containing protein n=1 Tax=Aphanomyces astaci TaxID=112090 RepID=A0A418ES61_APHAT|nr:hypothetical protein DYB37_004690 [Aphanomyces astaci]